MQCESMVNPSYAHYVRGIPRHGPWGMPKATPEKEQWRCSKEAKTVAVDKEGGQHQVCGLHARWHNYYGVTSPGRFVN